MKKNTNNQKQYFIMGGVRENKKDNLRMKYWKQKQKQKNEFEKKKFLTKNIRNKKKTFEFYIHRIIMRLFRLIKGKDLLNFFCHSIMMFVDNYQYNFFSLNSYEIHSEIDNKKNHNNNNNF